MADAVLLTIGQAAEVLCVSQRQAERLTRSGALPSVVVSGRTRRVRHSDLMAFIDELATKRAADADALAMEQAADAPAPAPAKRAVWPPVGLTRAELADATWNAP